MYTDFIDSLRTAWDYKFHNTKNNTVEPFPVNKKPSDIYRTINPKPDNKKKEYLYHADTLFKFNKLGKEKPFKVIIKDSSPKPFTDIIYSTTKDKAKNIAINKYVNYLKKNNVKFSNYSMVKDLIKRNFISLSVYEI